MKSPVLATLASLLACGTLSAQAPTTMKELVLHASHRQEATVVLDGVEFRSLARDPAVPFVMWPAEEGAPFAFDRDEARAFLERVLPTLGLTGFTLRATDDTAWRVNDVWNWELLHGGVPVFDATLQVHWHGREFVGIANDTPGPIVEVEAARDQSLFARPVLFARRSGSGYALRRGHVQRRRVGDHVERTVRSDDGGKVWHQNFSPVQGTLPTNQGGLFLFEEYSIPFGTFPDQIRVDQQGIVWYSQPSNNAISNFDPTTEQFTTIPITGSGPDGLFVDSRGHVWTGCYYSRELGKYNVNTQNFRKWVTPYSPSAPAIPVEDAAGLIWVTDHQYNRISQFDPGSRTWIQSRIMPTANCWVVEGNLHDSTGDLYFSCYNVNKLALLTSTGFLTDFSVSSGGPAFPVVSEDKVYYSLWNRATLGVYDIPTGNNTEYDYPVGGEVGGPIAKMPDGRIVVGTRNIGYIMVFDPNTQLFDAYKIPTPFPGLKDGINVDADGVIWFTESGKAKITKLRPVN